MKNKVKYIFLIIVMVSFIFSNRILAYEIIKSSEDNGILLVNYNVIQSEEDEFLNTIQTDYEKNNVNYEFIKLEKNEDEIPEKEVNETIELNNLLTNSEASIKNIVDETYHYEDEEGYIGELELSEVQTSTISNGVYEQIEKLDIPVFELSTNDLKDIEKSIDFEEKTWYLINADWETCSSENIAGREVATSYNGLLHYQTIVEYTNPDTYNAVVHYSGKVNLSNPVYKYTVTYKKIELEPEVIIEEKKTNYMIPVIIVSGIGIVLITTLILMKKKKNEK